MAQITDIRGIEILDSRGNPTVAATVVLQDGATGYAAAPSGASTGSREAVELRDKDASCFGGKSASKAVGHVNIELRKALLGCDSADQAAIDRAMIELDGTENKARLIRRLNAQKSVRQLAGNRLRHEPGCAVRLPRPS